MAYPVPTLPAEAFTRLPETEALDALQAAAAVAYGVRDPAMVVAAPGTQVLINLLPRLVPQRAVTVLGPTYAEHAAAWADAGTKVRLLPLPAGEGRGEGSRTKEAIPSCASLPGRRGGAGGLPLPEGEGDGLVLCNPNNPDGRRVAVAELLARVGRGLLMVDEAFADFAPGDSLAPHLPLPGVIVLRSFGKAYGLAGVRLGFALAEPGLAAVIRTALGPWAVSGPALHIGTQALQDPAWLRDADGRLHRDAARLDALLAGAGLHLLGGTALFRLVEGNAAWADRLGRAGILVRRFADAPGRLRFGIPGPDGWDRLVAALGAMP